MLRYLSSPGGMLTDHIAVQNYGLKALTLNLYPIDAVNGHDGAIGYLPKGTPTPGASAWVRIPAVDSTAQIRIPPRTARILPIQLAVPLKAAPGDHAAGIILSLTSKVKGKTGQLVDFEQRVALRIFVRVSGDLVAKLEIEKLRARFDGALNALGRGDVKVDYTVHNSGNVTLGGTQRVQISGLLGTAGSVSTLVDVPALLPGGTVSVSTTVKHVLSVFLMAAKVTVSPLAVPGDADPPLQDGVATTKFWAVPWIPLDVALCLALGIPVLIRRRLRRRQASGRHAGRQTPEPVKEKVQQ
jgi:hypothetical protein